MNLNVKAREELEKRKQAAKAAEALAEASVNSEDTVSPGKASKGEDNTPAIPITSYSSFNNEDDDQDDDDDSDSNAEETEDNSKESDGVNKNKINFDLKKRKLGVIKNTDILDKKKVKSSNGNDEDESDDSSYFNVFNSKADTGTNGTAAKPKTTNAARLTSKQLAALKTNVKKQPTVKQPILKQTLVKQQQQQIVSALPAKQPILKSGQAQAKDREEAKAKLFFIGPKLPSEVTATATAVSNSTEAKAEVAGTIQAAEDSVNTVSPKPGQLETNSWAHLNGNMAESAASEAVLSDKPVGPKINYTKDELAKYGDLSMMSQAYAKINQVGVVNFAPNGATEINMVELDQTQQHAVQQHGQQHQLPQAQLIANPNANNAALILHQEHMSLQNESKLQNDKLLEAYHQEQQKNALKAYHLQQQQAAAQQQQQQQAAAQQQQRSIQLQLQNIQQLRANQQIQQLNGLHNLQLVQAQQYLQAQQLQKVCLQLKYIFMSF